MLPVINKNNILKISDLFRAILGYDQTDLDMLNINPDIFHKYIFNRFNISFSTNDNNLVKKINSYDNIVVTNFNYTNDINQKINNLTILKITVTNAYYNHFIKDYESFKEKKTKKYYFDYFFSYVSKIEFIIDDKLFIVERFPEVVKNNSNEISFSNLKTVLYSQKDNKYYKSELQQSGMFILKNYNLPNNGNSYSHLNTQELNQHENIYQFHENFKDRNQSHFNFYLYDTIEFLDFVESNYNEVSEIIKKGPNFELPRYEVQQSTRITFSNFVKQAKWNKKNAHLYFQTIMYKGNSSDTNTIFRYQTVSGFTVDKAHIFLCMPFYIKQGDMEIQYVFEDVVSTTQTHQSKSFYINMYIKDSGKYYKKNIIYCPYDSGRKYIYQHSPYNSKGVKVLFTTTSPLNSFYNLFYGYSSSDVEMINGEKEVFGTWNNDYSANVIDKSKGVVNYHQANVYVPPTIHLTLDRNKILSGVTAISQQEYNSKVNMNGWTEGV